MRKHGLRPLVLCIVILTLMSGSVFAESTGASASSAGNYGFNVSELMDDLTDQGYIKEKPGWVMQQIIKLFGESLEEPFKSISQGYVDTVLKTPYMVEFGWVKGLWWRIFAVSIGLSAMASIVLIGSMLIGRRAAKLKILWVLLAAFILGYFSLWLTDKFIALTNDITYGILMDSLENEAQKNEKMYLDSDVDTDDPTLGDYDGKYVMMVSFGANFEERDEKDPFYTLFLTENGGDGMIIMCLNMVVLNLNGLMGMLKLFILGLLAASAPFWFCRASMLGSFKPIIGYTNLLVRTLMLQLIANGAWLGATYFANSDEMAAFPRQAIAGGCYWIAFFLSLFFWFRYVFYAGRQIGTLGADKVIENMQKTGDRWKKDAQQMGSWFNNPRLANLGKKKKKGNNTSESDARKKSEDMKKASEEARKESRRNKQNANSHKEGNQSSSVYYDTHDGNYVIYSQTLRRWVKTDRKPEYGDYAGIYEEDDDAA